MGMRILEAFLTSSVLIVVVLILRKLCRGKISLCLQYGIWLIVAVKLLLVPIPFLESPFSIMNLIDINTETANVETINAEPINAESMARYEGGGAVPGIDFNTETTYILNDTNTESTFIGEEGVKATETPSEQTNRTQHNFAPVEESMAGKEGAGNFWQSFLNAIPFVLYVNAFLLAAWMLFYNLKFYNKLRSARVPYEDEELGKDGKDPKIYLVEGLKTPCLYGMSIYLPVDVPGDERKLRHILAHETAHYRHKDFIWSFLRLICTALNWYNPLVWIAAAAERQDCELACDEAAIRALGEEERVPYGETLIRLVGEKSPQDVLTISTTMTGSRKEIKTRISLIARKPVTTAYMVMITGVVLMAAVFCTFTGKVEAAETPKTDSESSPEHFFEPAENRPIENEPTESKTAKSKTTESETTAVEEGIADGEGNREYTREELVAEFAELTEDNTFSVYVRSVSRSARVIDLFSMEIWNHIEPPCDYGELAFTEDCLYHFYSFQPESGTMEFQDVDFDGFVDGLSLDGITDVECKVTCKGGLVTDIVAYSAYGGITYSEPVEGRDYYDLHGTEGYQLVGTYMADVSEAEGMEKICIYSGNMGDGDGGYVIVEDGGSEDGQQEKILWIEEAHTARAGWNNVYLGEIDGEAFLFTLVIDVRDGFGTLAYHAFRLDAEGNPLPCDGAKYKYERETYQVQNFIQWYQAMSVYMSHSYLLLSIQEGTLKTGNGTAYGSRMPDNRLFEDSAADVAVPGTSDTMIPAPEQGGYELIELQQMIENGVF